MTTKPESIDPGYTGLRTKVETLPTWCYFDASHYERELERIWYRNWICLGRSSNLSEPRAYQVFDLGSQQIVVVRGDDQRLRAFHNTCRHRGSVLCNDETGRFRAGRITCPYHSWTYDLDGKLVRTTSLIQAEGFDPEDYSLYGVAVEELAGFVFVRIDGDQGPSVEESIDGYTERLAQWRLEEMVVGHTFRRVAECNWKVIWENYGECLHCPSIHPTLSKLVPLFGRRLQAETDDPHWKSHAQDEDPKYRGGLRKGAETWSMDGHAHGKPIESLSEEARRDGQSFGDCWPSAYFHGHIDYAHAAIVRPLGPERTEYTKIWLFPKATLEDDTFPLSNVVDFVKAVVVEDLDICEQTQKGMRSIRHEAGVIMPEEYYIKEFHDWVRRQLGPQSP